MGGDGRGAAWTGVAALLLGCGPAALGDVVDVEEVRYENNGSPIESTAFAIPLPQTLLPR